MPRSQRIFKKWKPRKKRSANDSIPTSNTPTSISAERPVPRTSQDPVSNLEERTSSFESASKRKLKCGMLDYDRFGVEDNKFQYNIIYFDALTELLNKICVCEYCGGDIIIFPKSLNGLAVNIHAKCKDCGFAVSKPNSKKLKYTVDNKEVNVAFHNQMIMCLSLFYLFYFSFVFFLLL